MTSNNIDNLDRKSLYKEITTITGKLFNQVIAESTELNSSGGNKRVGLSLETADGVFKNWTDTELQTLLTRLKSDNRNLSKVNMLGIKPQLDGIIHIDDRDIVTSIKGFNLDNIQNSDQFTFKLNSINNGDLSIYSITSQCFNIMKNSSYANKQAEYLYKLDISGVNFTSKNNNMGFPHLIELLVSCTKDTGSSYERASNAPIICDIDTINEITLISINLYKTANAKGLHKGMDKEIMLGNNYTALVGNNRDANFRLGFAYELKRHVDLLRIQSVYKKNLPLVYYNAISTASDMVDTVIDLILDRALIVTGHYGERLEGWSEVVATIENLINLSITEDGWKVGLSDTSRLNTELKSFATKGIAPEKLTLEDTDNNTDNKASLFDNLMLILLQLSYKINLKLNSVVLQR